MQSILESLSSNEASVPSERSSINRSHNFEPAVQQVDWVGLIEKLYSALLFLLPVFFLPITADPINLNKAYLTIVIALVTLLLFFVNGIQKGRLGILNIKAYVGFSLLALAAIISSVFSIDKDNSIFGHFGNYTDSLLFVISLVLIAFVASNIKLNLKNLVSAFVLGVTLSTVISLITLYGVGIPMLGSLPIVFSLAGPIYILMGLQIVAVLAALFISLNTESDKKRILFVIALVINGLYLIASLNVEALSILFVGLAFLFLFVHKSVSSKSKTVLIGALVALSLLGFVHHYPMTREALKLDENLNTQVRLPLRESWSITADTIKNIPLTGSGFGTFVNVYSGYRPASMNSGENWNIRYETPYSDAFLWLATTGLVGLLAYIAFFGFAISTVRNLNKTGETDRLLTLLIPIALLSLLILGNNPIVYVFIFLSLGIAIQRGNEKQLTIHSTSVIGIFTIAVIAMLGYVLLNAYNIYAGQYYFRESFLRDNLGERFKMQAKALQSNPRESVYHRAYISTGISIASILVTKQDLTDEEKQEIIRILSEAINNVSYISGTLEPSNVLNWSLRGDVYAAVMDLDQNADQLAVGAYTNAIRLEQTNPDLWINLGSVYYRRKVYNQAISAFVKAVELKPDYANARYNLAYALKDAGYLAEAATQMEVVLRLVKEGTPDYEKAKKEAEDFKKLADEAAANAQQAPEEVANIDNTTTNENGSDEPLVAPEDQPADKLTPNDEIEEEVNAIIEEDEEGEGRIMPAAADGSDVPEDGEEAPLTNPAN